MSYSFGATNIFCVCVVEENDYGERWNAWSWGESPWQDDPREGGLPSILLGPHQAELLGQPHASTLDAGAAIHVCNFWLRELFPLTETTQKVNSASGADTKVFGTPTIPLTFLASLSTFPVPCHFPLLRLPLHLSPLPFGFLDPSFHCLFRRQPPAWVLLRARLIPERSVGF